MKSVLGIDKYSGESIYWDAQRVVSGHSLFVGFSGSGKTHTIKRCINELGKSKNIKIYLFDVHGDILPEDELVSTISYTEFSNNGINPLIIDPDPEYGGVRKKIRMFVANMNATRKLGYKQEAALVNLLHDLYKSFGIKSDDPSTWSSKPPTITDLRIFIENKIKKMIAGGNESSIKLLEKISRKVSSMRKSLGESNIAEEEIEKLKHDYLMLTKEYLNSMDGSELEELIKYDSKEVIKGLYDRIVGLESTGIFKPGGTQFDKSKPIYRFDIKTLNDEEKKLFVSTMCELIFIKSRASGIKECVTDIIILDEAHKFIDEEGDNILNLIIKESRKFGLGLWMASQDLSHFSKDLIMNTSTKVILGVDELYYEQTARKIGVDIRTIKNIKARKTALLNLKNKDAGTGWAEVYVNI